MIHGESVDTRVSCSQSRRRPAFLVVHAFDRNCQHCRDVNYIINKEIKLDHLPDGHDLRVSCGVSVLHSEVVTCVVLFYQAVSDHGQV